MTRSVVTVMLALAAMLVVAPAAYAQEGQIAGTVRDASGGVMPGVTVEATSPALIEKIRVAVTGSDGQYRLTTLPVGTYTVVFKLAGFTSQQYDNIVLSSGFTAPVNATMTVGQLAEIRARAETAVCSNEGLWSEAEAQKTMRPLMPLVDVVIANEEDLQSVLGVHVAGADVASGALDAAGYRAAAERVTREFGPGIVAVTLRESLSASDNGWSAVLWDRDSGTMLQSQRYAVRLVDRIGGGDSFSAGLIYAMLAGRPLDAALRFAVAASALKQTIPGDFNRVSVAEVDALAGGDASGRVRR